MQVNQDQAIAQAQVIFVSHSGGKDSQAMLAKLKRMGLLHKCVIVHSDLGRMEWQEMKPWIEANSFGLPVHVVEAEQDFFQIARKYGRLPSGMHQFCTDLLKTKPICEFIHQYMTEHGLSLAINATGMRAEESPRRAKKEPFVLSKGQGTSKMHMPKKYPEHTVYDWMPIFHYPELAVKEEITHAGQSMHPVYAQGFSRLSCVLCVNGRIGEHKLAAEMRPELAREMAQLERDLGKTLRMKQVKGQKLPKYMDEYLPL